MSEVTQIALGVGVFLLIALITSAIAVLVRVAGKLDQLFQAADRALIPFGQTGAGELAHQAAAQAGRYMDEASDPAVIRTAELLNSVAFVRRLAIELGYTITAERVATIGRAVFAALAELTDGEPAEGLPLAERPGETAAAPSESA